MPNLRTTVITKKKAYNIVEDDLIKVGGRWYKVVYNDYLAIGSSRRHIIAYPESIDDSSERISIIVLATIKFNVRTAKYSKK